MSKRFYYPYTCPDIDKNIKHFKEYLDTNLRDIVDELCPLIKDTFLEKNFLTNYQDSIYTAAEEIFENVRDCNSKIRDEVDNVIQNIEEELNEAERLRDLFERKRDDLEIKVSDLEERIRELEMQIPA